MEEILDHEQHIPNKRTLNFIKPSLIKRIKASMIDAVFLILLMYIAFEILDGFNIQSGTMRGLALVTVFLYEPILVTINRTLGQKIIGLRVRNLPALENENERKNINFLFSIIRYIAKIMLGWLSLLTIHSDDYGRAIHDRLGASVMTVES